MKPQKGQEIYILKLTNAHHEQRNMEAENKIVPHNTKRDTSSKGQTEQEIKISQIKKIRLKVREFEKMKKIKEGKIKDQEENCKELTGRQKKKKA